MGNKLLADGNGMCSMSQKLLLTATERGGLLVIKAQLGLCWLMQESSIFQVCRGEAKEAELQSIPIRWMTGTHTMQMTKSGPWSLLLTVQNWVGLDAHCVLITGSVCVNVFSTLAWTGIWWNSEVTGWNGHIPKKVTSSNPASSKSAFCWITTQAQATLTSRQEGAEGHWEVELPE